MTDAEIDALIVEIDEMAQRIGCRFNPDPDKVMLFRRAQGTEKAKQHDMYKALMRRDGIDWRRGRSDSGCDM